MLPIIALSASRPVRCNAPSGAASVPRRSPFSATVPAALKSGAQGFARAGVTLLTRKP